MLLVAVFAALPVIVGGMQGVRTVEAVTVEIIRMMAGSVGLVLCIPITSFAAGLLMGSVGRRG